MMNSTNARTIEPASRQHPFLFATGIENSYPTIEGGRRIDQMEKCRHYERWDEDFELVKELGVDALRYGPAYYRTHIAPDRFDWSSADDPMQRLRELDVEVIADLCHFGVPDWLGSFQDPAFPVLFAEYARRFAQRYPWVRYYTPVNEIFVCANFSALLGWWNERERSDAAFVRAIRNMCMAHELAVEAIVSERRDAIFVQAESIEHFHPIGILASPSAAHLNALRFLSLDLTLGHELAPGMARFLNDHGVDSNDLSFFRERRVPDQRWIGLDYYATCEHRVASTGRQTTNRRALGLSTLATEYYQRYRKPLFHCETNRTSRLAPSWLRAQWAEVGRLRSAGIPVLGFTWYSLTDQMDWQYALRVERNHVHDVGLYDLDRRIRPVGVEFMRLMGEARAAESLGQGAEEPRLSA